MDDQKNIGKKKKLAGFGLSYCNLWWDLQAYAKPRSKVNHMCACAAFTTQANGCHW